jgi:hypothetical protein
MAYTRDKFELLTNKFIVIKCPITKKKNKIFFFIVLI